MLRMLGQKRNILKKAMHLKIKLHFIKEVAVFLGFALLITFLMVLLLRSYLRYGFSPDDWQFVYTYDAFRGNIFSKAISIWKFRGSYDTSQILYDGILVSILGLRYQAFQAINLVLRIIAVLSLYPAILIIFKKRSLAMFSTLFLSMSSATVGHFEVTAKGSESLSTILMSIFFIVYYLMVKSAKLKAKNIIFLALIFASAILFNPPRFFPLVLTPLFVYLFLRFTDTNRKTVKF